MTDIQPGDWIKVPKGTHLMKDYTKGNYGEGKAPTSRDVVVQVSKVDDIDDYYFRTLLSKEHYAEYNAALAKCGNTRAWEPGHTDETRAAAREKVASARADAISKIPGNPTKIICWSNDKKGALDSAVEKVAAPAPKKKAEPKINNRQKMVKGSRWKVTADVTIKYEQSNPVYDKVLNDWEIANPRPQPLQSWRQVGNSAVHVSHTKEARDEYHRKNQAWMTARQAEEERISETISHSIFVDYVSLKAGDILEVTGKFMSSWHPSRSYAYSVSNVCPMKLMDGSNKTYGLEYKQISPFIVEDSIPTVDIYLLRDKTTGLFFAGTSYETNWKLVWVDNFMKGKHFDGIGRAKTQLLMATGYYNNLPGADESLPDWAGGSSSLTITDDMELVHFDKLGRKEIGPVTDFQEWFKRAWELRELTVRYGSAVRSTYKALEKANMLDSQKGMVVFTVVDKKKLDEVGYWGEKTALSDDDKEEIKFATSSMAKGTFKKAIDHKSMAVSFTNKSAAMLFKLSYTGNLKLTVIDLEEMKEVVNG